MAIDTSGPYYFGQEFQYPEGNGITGFASGFMGGMAGAGGAGLRKSTTKAFKQDFKGAYGRNPTGAEKASNLEKSGVPKGNLLSDVFGGMLKAKGEKAKGADWMAEMRQRQMEQNEQIGQEQLQGMRQRNSLNDVLSQNAGSLVDQFGNLTTTEDRLRFLQDNAGIAVTPEGSRLYNQFRGITGSIALSESRSEKALMARERMKDMGELVTKWGAAPDDSQSIISARRNRSAMLLMENARKQGKAVKELPDNLFLPDGNLNALTVVPWVGNLPKDSTATGFAPPMKQKYYDLLKQAETEGDEAGVKIFSDALGLNKLEEIDKLRMRAEFDAVQDDTSLGAGERQRALDAIESKYRPKLTPSTGLKPQQSVDSQVEMLTRQVERLIKRGYPESPSVVAAQLTGDESMAKQPPAALGTKDNPIPLRHPKEALLLKPGMHFLDPNGNIRVR